MMIGQENKMGSFYKSCESKQSLGAAEPVKQKRF